MFERLAGMSPNKTETWIELGVRQKINNQDCCRMGRAPVMLLFCKLSARRFVSDARLVGIVPLN